MKQRKTERTELRLSVQELNALSKLSMHDGMESRSAWIRHQIRRQAKRKKVWQ